ncbi:MAG: DUF542 domain-containing protein [Gemmatimonadaceae bacterium]
MPKTVPLDPTLTVNDIVLAIPAALIPLSARGIDTCCRGNESLATAAAAIGVDPMIIIAEIEATPDVSGAPTPSACGCANSPRRDH